MALGHEEREGGGGGGGQVELGAETAACGRELVAPAPAPAAGLAKPNLRADHRQRALNLRVWH